MRRFSAGTWQASNWGEDEPDGVTVYRPGEESWDHLISHERQIEDAIPDAPEELKAHVRGQLPKPCPTCKGEGKVWEDNCGPNMWREDCPKCRPKLAENEVIGSDGLRRELRWHNGRAEIRICGNKDWSRREFGAGGLDDTWFRTHCPIDRFVTDAGEVLRFEMRDDGEAETVRYGKRYYRTGSPGGADGRPVFEALYRFRDHERGKWEFHESPGCVQVWHEGIARGNITSDGPSPGMQDRPTWVRQKAEALYREKNPEWRTDWVPGFAHVAVMRNGKFVCALDSDGWPENTKEIVPRPIMEQARAKFRENYQLKRDELWFRGMPVKMVFGPDDSDGATDEYSVKAPCTKAVWASWSEGRSCSRDEWCASDGLLEWADNSERLEAHDRMRRFYYEEHPARGVDPDGYLVRFEMSGTIGKAVYVDHPTATMATSTRVGDTGCREVDRRWGEIVTKLRTWTTEQLKKREGEKVVFEGKWKEIALDNSRVTFEAFSGELPGIPGGPLRVTIEPLGDG